jgi:hypothetical protein
VDIVHELAHIKGRLSCLPESDSWSLRKLGALVVLKLEYVAGEMKLGMEVGAGKYRQPVMSLTLYLPKSDCELQTGRYKFMIEQLNFDEYCFIS